MIPAINEQIVKTRQERSSFLQQITEQCQTLSSRLQHVNTALNGLASTDSSEIKNCRLEIQKLIKELDEFYDRLMVRYNRFKKGLITISIAGLEKAGKTTFLKSLTGIESLPAFDERCTAVCCEIHYSDERSDFDIEFYTESEFIDNVLRPVIETIANALPDDYEFIPPLSANEFISLDLPSSELVARGTTAFKLLNDIKQLQKNFHECRQYLGNSPLLRRPLSELGQWVSHPKSEIDNLLTGDSSIITNKARMASVKVCRIYSNFKGGSPHLRWIDTPGVDDPNRRARDLTLAAISSDTDLLVVASRPGSNPSPGENFHNFWDSVSRQPDEINLMNRLLFVLNWDRRVDPDAENIKIHRKYLTDAGVPRQLFIGPFEAIKKSDAAALMEKVNEHLKTHLPDQDDQIILEFKSRLKNIQARIRLIHDVLAKNHPSDERQHDMETEAFHKWFHWYTKGKDTGFWTDLVAALDRATRDILEDNRIKESENSLNAIFAQEINKIQKQIPNSDELEDYWVRHRGENPIPNGMRTISTYFSKLVNKLASEVQEFGPIMQDKLLQVFADSGLGPLLNKEQPEDKLKNLLDILSLDAEHKSAILEVLQETLELPRNLKYVIRYELRAAVDFCDPTLWNKNEDAWNRLKEMVKANAGDVDRLAKFKTHKHPPITDSREDDYEILKKIAGNAMFAINTALNNERYLPRRIADDFMRDCRVRLCFSPDSQQEWRTLLFRTRSLLISRVISQIRAESEGIRAFQLSLNNLDMVLP